MNNVLQTRDAIVARVLALSSEATNDRQWVLLELAALDEHSDPAVAAGVFEAAGEASTAWTSDECWDDEIDELVQAFHDAQ